MSDKAISDSDSKRCARCRKPFTRRMFTSGRSEAPCAFRKRLYCSKVCAGTVNAFNRKERKTYQTKPDDWEKPRSNGQHLNEDEIRTLRQSWVNGSSPRNAARKVFCSTRVAVKYFAKFRDGLFAGLNDKKPFDPVKARNERFYRGSFEL